MPFLGHSQLFNGDPCDLSTEKCLPNLDILKLELAVNSFQVVTVTKVFALNTGHELFFFWCVKSLSHKVTLRMK